MKDIPLLFTPTNRDLVRRGLKTETRRGYDKLNSPSLPGYPALTPDNDWIFWSHPTSEDETARCYPRGSNEGFRSPYGCPQREQTRYWMREPVQILELKDNPVLPESSARIRYLDDGTTSLVPLTEKDYFKLLSRKDWRRPTTAMHMLKSFTRTWLPGVRVWPERLGEMSEESALAEGIQHVHDIHRPYLKRFSYGWNELNWTGKAPSQPTAMDAYRHLWDSINGPGSWDPEKWVWAIKFEPPGGAQ